MKKKIGLIVVMLMMLFLPVKVSAVSGSIWASPNSTTIAPGESITITYGFSASEESSVQLSLSASGPGSISNGTVAFNGGNPAMSSSSSITVTAHSEGTIRITGSVVVFESVNGGDASASVPTVTINVKKPVAAPSTPSNPSTPSTPTYQPQTNVSVAPPNQVLREEADQKSSNAYLHSLTVDKGKMTPEFNSEILEYTLDLAENTTSVEVSAAVAHEKATLSGNGSVEVKEGKNEHNITVTAEDGTTKTYKLTLNVLEKPKFEIDLHSKKRGVLSILPETLPAGYSQTEIEINSVKVNALKHDTLNTVLIYTRDENGKLGWVYYNEVNKKYASYEELEMNGKKYVLGFVDEEDKKIGMHYSFSTINEKEIYALVYDDSTLDRFTVLPLYNDKNELNLYQYDKTEQTLQVYADNSKTVNENYLKLQNEVKILNNHKFALLIATGVFALTTVIAIGYIIFNAYKSKK